MDIVPDFSISNDSTISNDGEIALVDSLDYESDTERIIFSDVQEDTYNISTDLIICVLDVNDNVPTSPVPTFLTMNTPESNVSVSDFTMRFYSDDADSDLNGIVTFSLVDVTPNNNNLFRIDSNGTLLNIEALTEGMFTIIVQATDGGSPALSSQTNFTLTVATGTGNTVVLLCQNNYCSKIGISSLYTHK